MTIFKILLYTFCAFICVIPSLILILGISEQDKYSYIFRTSKSVPKYLFFVSFFEIVSYVGVNIYFSKGINTFVPVLQRHFIVSVIHLFVFNTLLFIVTSYLFRLKKITVFEEDVYINDEVLKIYKENQLLIYKYYNIYKKDLNTKNIENLYLLKKPNFLKRFFIVRNIESEKKELLVALKIHQYFPSFIKIYTAEKVSKERILIYFNSLDLVVAEVLEEYNEKKSWKYVVDKEADIKLSSDIIDDVALDLEIFKKLHKKNRN